MSQSISVERVRAALLAAGHPDAITEFPEGTRTAADAAAAVGCTVAQIAKSIVLRAGERAVLVITSGANRVDAKKVEAAIGMPVKRADADFVRAATGFAIGGVAPLGSADPTKPNLAPTIYRTAADLTSRTYFYESTLAPNVVWVDLKALDFSEKSPVLMLDLSDRPELTGDVAGKFQASKPFSYTK